MALKISSARRATVGRSLLLVLLPLVWSLPTALLVGELASAMPEDGGFYVWVRRALGPFWGFQESWLSLVASVFDMALYPTLFVAYLGTLAPSLVAGHRAFLWAAGVVVICVAWNLLGAYDVGEGARWMFVLFLLPFVVIVVLAVWIASSHPLGPRDFHPPGGALLPSHGALGAALLVALWNTMGWDNASTVAREVEHPQRTYIVAMLGAVAVVTVSYVLPIAASAAAGISADQFATGAWVEVARRLGGAFPASHLAAWLPIAVTVGGCLTAVGMFNALTMSYARVPYAMALDSKSPVAQILKRTNRRRAPWVCILGLRMLLVTRAGPEFSRLIVIDVTIYGAEPAARVRGARGAAGAGAGESSVRFGCRAGCRWRCCCGVPSALLLGYAAWASRAERMAAHPALAWCAGLALLGPVVWLATRIPRNGGS